MHPRGRNQRPDLKAHRHTLIYRTPTNNKGCLDKGVVVALAVVKNVHGRYAGPAIHHAMASLRDHCWPSKLHRVEKNSLDTSGPNLRLPQPLQLFHTSTILHYQYLPPVSGAAANTTATAAANTTATATATATARSTAPRPLLQQRERRGRPKPLLAKAQLLAATLPDPIQKHPNSPGSNSMQSDSFRREPILLMRVGAHEPHQLGAQGAAGLPIQVPQRVEQAIPIARMEGYIVTHRLFETTDPTCGSSSYSFKSCWIQLSSQPAEIPSCLRSLVTFVKISSISWAVNGTFKLAMIVEPQRHQVPKSW